MNNRGKHVGGRKTDPIVTAQVKAVVDGLIKAGNSAAQIDDATKYDGLVARLAIGAKLTHATGNRILTDLAKKFTLSERPTPARVVVQTIPAAQVADTPNGTGRIRTCENMIQEVIVDMRTLDPDIVGALRQRLVMAINA